MEVGNNMESKPVGLLGPPAKRDVLSGISIVRCALRHHPDRRRN